MFFWSRVVYAAVYYAGIPWLRTGVWGVSVVGMVMIFLQILWPHHHVSGVFTLRAPEHQSASTTGARASDCGRTAPIMAACV